ncbi:MAG: hypothetical protein AAF840_15550, partial [Bacteroidota bacterium]
MWRFFFFSLVLLLVSLITGCGLVADSLTGDIKNKLSPRQVLEQKAGDALRDEFFGAIGIDPQAFGEGQPLNRRETVSETLPVAFTEVPGMLRFHNRAGFRLNNFIGYMRSTYGVQLTAERSSTDPLTGGRIYRLKQLHEGLEVYGAFYRAISNQQEEITRATGHVYDSLQDVSFQVTLKEEEVLAPLKAAYPSISEWVIATNDTFRIDPLPTNTAIIYPAKLMVMPKALHPEERNELVAKYRVVGLSYLEDDQVFLGANRAGIIKITTNVRTQAAKEYGVSASTAKVNTRFYGRRTIPTIRIRRRQNGPQMDSVLRTVLSVNKVPEGAVYYGL